MSTDRILERYPEAIPGGGSPGYSYDFPEFTVIKNISGTLGWIGVIKENKNVIDAHTAEECIKRCKRRVSIIKMTRDDKELE